MNQRTKTDKAIYKGDADPSYNDDKGRYYPL